jgi:hypothetical protein
MAMSAAAAQAVRYGVVFMSVVSGVVLGKVEALMRN